jgi:hypothetical protein
MPEFIPSRQLVDIVIALTLIECVFLLVFHQVKKRGLAPGEYLLNLTSGLCLMFALRCALADAAWIWIALWLMASGLAHGTDLWRRWHREA